MNTPWNPSKSRCSERQWGDLLTIWTCEYTRFYNSKYKTNPLPVLRRHSPSLKSWTLWIQVNHIFRRKGKADSTCWPEITIKVHKADHAHFSVSQICLNQDCPKEMFSTPPGAHSAMCRWHVVEWYAWSLYNFIDRCNPNKFDKKKKPRTKYSNSYSWSEFRCMRSI